MPMFEFKKDKIFSLCVILLLLLKSSCGPDENEPVRVNFEVKLEVGSPMPAHFTFTRIVGSIRSIRFVGTRQAGNDVVFNTRPGQTVGNFDLNPTLLNTPITWFDIPEGIYNSMRWEIQTQELETVFDFDDFISMDDEFGLLIEGTYTRLDATRIRLIIALHEDDLVKFESVNVQGQLPITLVTGTTYTAVLQINPFSILGAIPRTLLEQADLQGDDDDNYFLVISSDVNPELYNLLLLSLSRNLRAFIR